ALSAGRAQERPITWAARVEPRTVAPGGRARIELSATVPYGWHLYSLTEPPGGPIATSIALLERGDISAAGPITAPPPDRLPDRNFQIITESYADSVTFTVPISVASSAKAGRRSARVAVGYQTCTDRYCLPPMADTLDAALSVAGEPIAANAVATTA